MMKIEKNDIDSELLDEIADRVFQKLKPLLSKRQPEGEDIIFDVKGLADYPGVTPKWIYERTHFKGIPFYKLGNKQLRFRKKDIDKWLETVKTPAIESFSWKSYVIHKLSEQLIVSQFSTKNNPLISNGYQSLYSELYTQILLHHFPEWCIKWGIN